MHACAWGYLGVHSAELIFFVHFAVRYQILTKHQHIAQPEIYVYLYIHSLVSALEVLHIPLLYPLKIFIQSIYAIV